MEIIISLLILSIMCFVLYIKFYKKLWYSFVIKIVYNVALFVCGYLMVKDTVFVIDKRISINILAIMIILVLLILLELSSYLIIDCTMPERVRLLRRIGFALFIGSLIVSVIAPIESDIRAAKETISSIKGFEYLDSK